MKSLAWPHKTHKRLIQDSVPDLFDCKAINHLAKFPCHDVKFNQRRYRFQNSSLKEILSWKLRRRLILYSIWVHFKRNAKYLGTEKGKGALKKKQTTAIKSQMANIWTACGRAEFAAVWITKVWQIFYSVLIWLSQLAFSFFGTASHIWTKMPFHEAVYCWGLSCRLSVLFSTSLCLCAAGEGSHNVWWLFTSYSLPCA